MSTSEFSRHHGGIHPRFAAEAGVVADQVIDFSVNVNPFGPTQRVRDAILAAPIDEYPDPESWEVRCALGSHWDRPPDEIAVGNGACELLWTLAKLFHHPGEVAITVDPTFSEYEVAVRSAGGVVRSVRAEESSHFAFPVEMILEETRASKARSVYLCCPTSPLGQLVEVEGLRALAQRLNPVRLIVDESFLSLSEEAVGREPLLGENVIIVRSLTKELATPGVRIGYLIANPEVVAGLDAHRPRWTVSAAAQAAAIASLGDGEELADARSNIAALRRKQLDVLRCHGFFPFPGAANYLTALSPLPVPELKARLLQEHHIMVRDCASFGLPRFARFAVRPEPELVRLDDALRQVLEGPQR